jgi:ribosomal protein S18 acetylase RimI-like enzyme
MKYRRECGRCHTPLAPEGPAYICANECSYCPTCYRHLQFACSNCSGELVRRPRPRAIRPVGEAAVPAPDPEVRVRRATAADIEKVGPLFDGYRQFYEQSSDRAASDRFLRERFSRDESVILVADHQGAIVGFVQFYPLFSSISLGRVYLLNDLYVDPSHRRRGVGRLLLDAAREFGRREGAHYLELSTAVDNPAQRLYESCGWVLDRGFLYYELPLPVPTQGP